MGNKNSKKSSSMDKLVDVIMQNKKIFALILIIIVVLIIFKVAIREVDDKKEVEEVKANIDNIIKNQKTKIIFVGSSDSNKCSKCQAVKDYLKKEKIEYVDYDVENYSADEYNKMLQSIEINSNDFGYPGIVYIRNGRLYSNIININDIKSVETFIEDNDLKTELYN